MNAPLVRDQLSFSLGELTYIGPDFADGPEASILSGRTRGFSAWIARQVCKFAEWQRRRAVMREMSLLTDHELSDIGLSRSDLCRVFDPGFAADHRRGRDYVAY
jgi:uncharacterized protein YjiS (DUF1127 family)